MASVRSSSAAASEAASVAARRAAAVAKVGGKAAAGCAFSSATGFRDFLLRGNIVDMAVAFVVGGAFSKLVDATVASFITPLISAIWGGAHFENVGFTINKSEFKVGMFFNAAIAFFMVSLIVYFLVVLPMMRVKALLAKPEGTPKRTCPECCEPVADKARRCKSCCTVLGPKAVEVGPTMTATAGPAPVGSDETV